MIPICNKSNYLILYLLNMEVKINTRLEESQLFIHFFIEGRVKMEWSLGGMRHKMYNLCRQGWGLSFIT